MKKKNDNESFMVIAWIMMTKCNAFLPLFLFLINLFSNKLVVQYTRKTEVHKYCWLFLILHFLLSRYNYIITEIKTIGIAIP